MKAIVLFARNLTQWSLPHGLFVIPVLFLLICLALCRTTHAVTPAPDGGYAGNNTAEGTSALFSLTSGTNNTAIGFRSLYHDINGSNNTAVGMNALFNNTTGDFNLPMACKLSLATLAALTTWLLVLVRCLVTPLAATTSLRVLTRSLI